MLELKKIFTFSIKNESFIVMTYTRSEFYTREAIESTCAKNSQIPRKWFERVSNRLLFQYRTCNCYCIKKSSVIQLNWFEILLTSILKYTYIWYIQNSLSKYDSQDREIKTESESQSLPLQPTTNTSHNFND